MKLKRWKLTQADPECAGALRDQLGLPRLVCDLLAARGYGEPEAARAFLGRGQALCDPYQLKDMEKAVARIRRAIAEDTYIAIYGDFDCDGITATVLLYTYLESAGANVAYYIPDREEEGYGMNREAVQVLKENGVGLIVTVDNGISACDEIAYAAELGIDVVVTDHHEPPQQLPVCAAVVNPRQADCPAPCKEIAGVGVAFKLVCALEEDHSCLETLEYYAEIVAIGTVADVVPLVGENRVLVQAGLRQLAETERPGLRALLQAAGLQGGLRADAVAFGLAPRLNASSRVGKVEDAVDLLLTEDEEQAQALAERMNENNQRRRGYEAEIFSDIQAQFAAQPERATRRVLVAAGRGYRHGVVGIVASRLVERYGRPAFVIGLEGDEGRGSCRGVEGFSVVEALRACEDLLTRYGGHPLAGGFSLPADRVEAFARRLEEHCAARYPVMPVPALCLDRRVTPADLTLGTVDALECLEPFGAGNPAPLFLLEGARVESATPVGEGKHLRLELSRQGARVSIICFGLSPGRFAFRPGDLVDAAVSLSASEYRGERRPSVRLAALRRHGVDQEALLLDIARWEEYCRGALEEAPDPPGRDEVATVYRLLRRLAPCPEELLLWRLIGEEMSYCQAMLALRVLCEAGLVTYTQGDDPQLALVPVQGKVELTRSETFRRLQRQPV